MEKVSLSPGVFLVDVPEADLRILCGCPADSVKHLKRRGLVLTKEKGGVSYETGPNAILLSDVTIQNGEIANLAEFPVLHMFYKQGMIVPGHPNNTGSRPILIGIRDQLIAQSRYIFRGNYGLSSAEEIEAAGIARAEADEMMRMKMRFAFGAIRKTEDLLDLRIAGSDPVEIRDGVFIRRTALNRYIVSRGGESCDVDLNLKRGETYAAPYLLPYGRVDPEYFSVVHTGEGDGWDPDRPCMASLITFQGGIYLIDAGPGILSSLTALGIGVGEIRGIFHTHCHDDHFAGLASLIRADHMIDYFATPLVRASVTRKLCALLSIGEEEFARYFRVRDLVFDEWNRVEGLEVLPLFSAHPVETSIMYFRAACAGGYKTYGHLADIASLGVLRSFLSADGGRTGISPEFYEKIRRSMFIPADIKKIDAGKGTIHGNAADFEEDQSARIILSHSAEEFSLKEREIGSTAVFGQADVLIPGREDYAAESARNLLRAYFPEAGRKLVETLLDRPTAEFPPGTIILRKGRVCRNVYLVVTGLAEAVDAGAEIANRLSAGALLGEAAFLENGKSDFTYRAASRLRALEIPLDLFSSFIREAGVLDAVKELAAGRRFLRQTDLFGEMLSYPVQNELARAMKTEVFAAGGTIRNTSAPDLRLLRKGSAVLKSEEAVVETLRPGDFFGEEGTLMETASVFAVEFLEDAEALVFPGDTLKKIPVVRLKLLETWKRRMSAFASVFSFAWKESYGVGVREIDDQHRRLFELVRCVRASCGGSADDTDLDARLDRLAEFARRHFAYEEDLLRRHSYPHLAPLREEHAEILRRLDLYRARLCGSGGESEIDLLEYLKGWVVAHTLTEDRKYGPALKAAGVF